VGTSVVTVTTVATITTVPIAARPTVADITTATDITTMAVRIAVPRIGDTAVHTPTTTMVAATTTTVDTAVAPLAARTTTMITTTRGTMIGCMYRRPGITIATKFRIQNLELRIICLTGQDIYFV